MRHLSEKLFTSMRPRLMAIGYRMLSSVHEAEDLVQDVWLRWHDDCSASDEVILNQEAWLITVTTRMAIDRLRAAKVRRQEYPGLWLPEPLLTDGPVTPEQAHEQAGDISTAFLLILDCLSPEARAAFLMREVFESEYDQVAMAIGKSEAATRQIVHRAKRRLLKAREVAGSSTFPTPPQKQLELLRRLVQAISQGDFSVIQALLTEEAELQGDFGSVVPNLAKPLRGHRRISQLYLASYLRHGTNMRLEVAQLNGEWALVRYIGGELDSVQTFEFDTGRISRVWLQRNPEKLLHLKKQLL